jgi:enamine deaminase RidA (YjgF/YER057c/UK114 family)
MSYSKDIRYDIFYADGADFETMVDELFSKVSDLKYPIRLTFFGTPADNEQYLKRRELLCEKTARIYGDKEPVVCYVSQPPLGCKLVLEAHYLESIPETVSIHYNKHDGFPYVVVNAPEAKMLFSGGFHGDMLNENISEQSDETFRKLDDLLRKEEMPKDDIARQWNYIERITDFDGEDQHYQMFNNSRSRFYSDVVWSKGYPAATGIGTNLGGVVIDADVVRPIGDSCRLVPIDNKLQVAAHAYSVSVLENAGEKRTTPKFERAKKLAFEGGEELIYVSGTAAIRGEESLKGVGVERQLRITMENIAELIGGAPLKLLRVYLKHPEDYSVVKDGLEEYGLDIPVSYLCADVCREELLIEIEGIASK